MEEAPVVGESSVVEQPSKPGRAPRPRSMKIFMIIMTILWLLALLPAGAFALMSPFAFDQGTSDAAWRVFVGLIGAPFALLLSLLVAWVLFAARLYKAAVVVMLFPALYLVVFFIVA